MLSSDRQPSSDNNLTKAKMQLCGCILLLLIAAVYAASGINKYGFTEQGWITLAVIVLLAVAFGLFARKTFRKRKDKG
jgi:hypothetical protein